MKINEFEFQDKNGNEIEPTKKQLIIYINHLHEQIKDLEKFKKQLAIKSKDYLLYVRKYSIISNDYEFYIYHCRTNDIFHTIGEMYYRTLERIVRITFVDDTPCRRKFWLAENKEILEWNDKYVGVIL